MFQEQMNNICDEHGAMLSCNPHGLICPLYTNTKNDLSPVHKYKNRRMQQQDKADC